MNSWTFFSYCPKVKSRQKRINTVEKCEKRVTSGKKKIKKNEANLWLKALNDAENSFILLTDSLQIKLI